MAATDIVISGNSLTTAYFPQCGSFGIFDDASCARPIANSRSWNLRVRGR